MLRGRGSTLAPFWCCLLTLRANWPLDTQHMEVANSVLQLMARRAPRMRIALANARMRLKKGAARYRRSMQGTPRGSL